jgi:hypothetical protein
VIEQIQQAINVLFQPGQAINVRGLKSSGQMSSKLYTDHEYASKVIDGADGNVDYKAIFYTIQRIKPGTEIQPFKGVKDTDIEAYEWLVIDVDTVRPDKAKSNATDAEKAASLEVTNKIAVYMVEERGFPQPITADSGNGWHLYFKLESIPNTPGNYDLLTNCLKAIAYKFREDRAVAEVDISMADPAQLTKAYGTLVRKGPHSPERPWRQSKLVSIPNPVEAANRIRLVLLSAEAPVLQKTKEMPELDEDFDVYDFAKWFGLNIVNEFSEGSKTFFVLDECPHVGYKHSGDENKSALVLGDTFGFKCFSDDCTDFGIGPLLKKLHEDHERYPKPIWEGQGEIQEIDFDGCSWVESVYDEAASTATGHIVTDEEFAKAMGIKIEEAKEKCYREDCNCGLEHVVANAPVVEVEVPEQVAIVRRAPLEEMPENCMHGYLAQRARDIQVPFGYGYPALLAAASTIAKPSESFGPVRTNLYVALLGPVGRGKTVATSRAVRALLMADLLTNRLTPGSDRGLIGLFKKSAGKPALLLQDEFRNTMAKASIQGSSLAPVICQLWSEDVAGAADKKGVEECDVKLSILGNLACADGIEFAEIFGQQTSKGMADRFILGLAPESKWTDVQVHQDDREGVPCRVPGWVFEKKHEWEQKNGRSRLGEMVLRVALVTSSMNGETEITEAALQAAFRFCEWQLAIRGEYAPGISENLDAKCTEAVLLTFHRLKQDYPDKLWKFSDIAKKKKWYAKFSSPMLSRVKKSLISEGVLGFDEESKGVWLI